MLHRVSKWRFVECCLVVGHVGTEVDDPEVPIAPSDVEPVEPRFHDDCVRLAVRIGQAEPFSSQLTGDIEWPGFLNSDVSGFLVLAERLCKSQIAATLLIRR